VVKQLQDQLWEQINGPDAIWYWQQKCQMTVQIWEMIDWDALALAYKEIPSSNADGPLSGPWVTLVMEKYGQMEFLIVSNMPTLWHYTQRQSTCDPVPRPSSHAGLGDKSEEPERVA